MFSARPSHVPVYLMHGFGDFGDIDTSMEGLISVIANAVSSYFRPATVTPTVTPQPVIQPTSAEGISPILLIGGGLLAWYLIKKRKGKTTKEVI